MPMYLWLHSNEHWQTCAYTLPSMCVDRRQFLSWTLSIVQILWQIMYFGKASVLSDIVSGKENQTIANIQGPDKEYTSDISV